MTIKEYMKENQDYDVLEDIELPFANPDDSKEAEVNLEYVLREYPFDLQALAVVVRSYYDGTILWENF